MITGLTGRCRNHRAEGDARRLGKGTIGCV
jgi:hypothetical protein